MIERDLQSFEDMGARFRFFQIELGAPRDDFLPMLDVQLQHLFQRQHSRLAVDEREHVDAKPRLQRRVLEQLIDDGLAGPRRASIRR